MSVSDDKKLVRNTFEIIIIATLLSAMLALAIISVVNDMYAFVKPDSNVSLDISEPLSLRAISLKLQDEGIIKNPTVFCIFVKSKGKQESLESFIGQAALRQDMSYREIMLALS